MFNVRCKIETPVRVVAEADVLDPPVGLYSYDEDGNCIINPTPESETMRVPQDGARLELKNLAKYGAAMMSEEYIPVNNLDRIQTAQAITRYCSKLNTQPSKESVNDEAQAPF